MNALEEKEKEGGLNPAELKSYRGETEHAVVVTKRSRLWIAITAFLVGCSGIVDESRIGLEVADGIVILWY
jgi:hypothetical protein